MSGSIPSSSAAPANGVPPEDRNLSASGNRRAVSSTYWCYECDAGVSVAPLALPLLCPICHGGFLEQMELPQAEDHGSEEIVMVSSDEGDELASPPPPPPEYLYHFDDDDLGSPPPPPPPPFPEFLLESDEDSDPGPHRLFFRTFAGSLPHSTTQRRVDDLLDDLVPEGDPLVASRNVPAPKSSIDALPTVSVTDDFLAEDPHRLCAVCKDEFVLGSEVKRLPCCHIYHDDCIVPWLSRHNSCPLCRSQLPVPRGGGGSYRPIRPRLFHRLREIRLPIRGMSRSPAITTLASGDAVFSASPRSRPPSLEHRRLVAAGLPLMSESVDSWSDFFDDEGMDVEQTRNIATDNSHNSLSEPRSEVGPATNSWDYFSRIRAQYPPGI